MENQNNKNNNENIPDCCRTNSKKESKGIMQGLIFGTIPHIGCIAFIIASILGATVLMQVFKPLLMNRFFFYYLILISLGFAALSSFFYLKKRNSLSKEGIKNNKTYLSIMFASTIGINILFFFVLFPYLANINSGVSAQEINGLSNIKLQVDIPCPGHAPLISSELKTLEGVKGSEFSFPNYFVIYYDSKITDKNKILSLNVFKEFTAKVLEENSSVDYISNNLVINNNSESQKSIIKNNIQEISMNVDSNGYSPSSFILKKSIKVKWIINVKELTGCNKEILLKDYNISKVLIQGQNIIEFTPDKEGTITFTCGMGMLKGNFLITESGEATTEQLSSLSAIKSSSRSCGCK